MDESTDNLSLRIQHTLTSLGADPALVKSRQLPIFEDASDMVIAETDTEGKHHRLVPAAAEAWGLLKSAAARDGCSIYVVSAFRGFERQLEIVRTAVKSGRSIDEIFKFVAPPGCSEHHTGRAIDIGTPGCEDLVESFAETDAFSWLTRNASIYGFRLSFDRQNRFGYGYEPWHWCMV